MLHPESSIFLGIIRLSSAIVILFYLNRKYIDNTHSLTILDFSIFNWLKYGSSLIVIIFTLIMVNAYNFFNCILFFLIIFSADYLLLKLPKKPGDNIIIIKDLLISILKKAENKESNEKFLRRSKKNNIKFNNADAIVIALCVVTILIHFYFIDYDKNIFSETWINDLNNISNNDLQMWFSNDYSFNGELALVNFYSKFVDVSPEVAMQSIAILESILLAILIFWTVNKMAPSRYIISIIPSFFFSLVYVLSPLNINNLLEKNSIFIALSLAIPIFIYFLKPPIQYITLENFFCICFLSFIAIGLIDLFTLLILIPPVIILSLFFTKKAYTLVSIHSALTYLLSLSVLLEIYSIYCYYYNIDLIEYFHNNLISVNSSSYNPQLVLPYEKIVFILECFTYVGLILLMTLLYFKKINLRVYFSSFIYFSFLTMLTRIENEWIDKDLLFKSFAVFLPIAVGLLLGIIYKIIDSGLQIPMKYSIFQSYILMFLLIFFAIFFQQKKIYSLKKPDQTPQLIFTAYNAIAHDFFPFTYTVVNDSRGQMISLKKHFFMNFSFFSTEYLNLDIIYFTNRLKPKFLKNNPEFALTSSVLVFAFKKVDIFSLEEVPLVLIKKNLSILRKRGRKIDLYYDNKNVKVYEIVNEPSKSKISDLIF